MTLKMGNIIITLYKYDLYSSKEVLKSLPFELYKMSFYLKGVLLMNIDSSIQLAENSMLKNYPEMIHVWDFEKNHELDLDIHKVTKGSNKKVHWKCQYGHTWIKTINAQVRKNQCKFCKDGFSTPEKIVYLVLKNSKVVFIYEKSFEWSNRKRYDFFLPDHNTIIEVHGLQHYENRGFKNIGGKSLKDEVENDEYKYQLAKENGIHHYIVIDARYSDFEYIKENIMKSKLSDIIDLSKDWESIKSSSRNSLYIEVCNLWNSGINDLSTISEITSLNEWRISCYLRQSKKEKLTDYDAYMKGKQPIVQLSLNGKYINTHTSFNSTGKIKRNAVIACADNKSKSHAGFLWIYKDDYDKIKNTEGNIDVVIDKEFVIVQLTMKGEYVQTWKNAKQASSFTNIAYTSIYSCIKGRKVTAGGFRWMFLEEYEDKLSRNESIGVI